MLVHTDDHAARLTEAAPDRGMQIPEDLTVVAYNDEYAQFGAVPSALTRSARIVSVVRAVTRNGSLLEAGG
ncbi:substrate-binding domain-containing protein [Occultella kanbiaonis]|uniref:substrate-binding domain-containing protein n=1 Tax=Occultella kanbiaonis TaxID=2675754 RepID=UPI00143DD438